MAENCKIDDCQQNLLNAEIMLLHHAVIQRTMLSPASSSDCLSTHKAFWLSLARRPHALPRSQIQTLDAENPAIGGDDSGKAALSIDDLCHSVCCTLPTTFLGGPLRLALRRLNTGIVGFCVCIPHIHEIGV